MEAEEVVQQATMIAHWAQKVGCRIGSATNAMFQPHNNIYTILACNTH